MASFWRRKDAGARTDDAKDGARTDLTAENGNANDAIAKVETIYRLDWQREYALDRERVWKAISEEGEISGWMKFATRLELRAGGEVKIDFGGQGSLEGVVCNVEPPSLLMYTWGDSLVKWSLEEENGQTRLHLSHIGVRPELVAGLGAGWHAFLDQLEDSLTGGSRPGRYRELKGRYEERVPS